MKKYYLLVIMCLTLVGCSSVNINKETFINKIDNNFSDMLTISDQELTNDYQINLDVFKDYIFKISLNDPINVYVLVLPKNSKEAKKEIGKFFTKTEIRVNNTNKKRLENRYNNNYGDYLFYIVSNNNKEIYKQMKEFIEK